MTRQVRNSKRISGCLLLLANSVTRSSPHLIIGECKSFNRFEQRDFVRAEQAATLFPGAILCFCTFNESLDKNEIKGLTKLAKQGRKRMDVGKQTIRF